MSARIPNPFRLALFWLGIQAVWGALLGVSLESRSIELVAANPQVASNRLAALGAAVAALTQVIVGFVSDKRRAQGSRRLEFYALGAVGGAVAIAAFYSVQNFVALTAAYVAVQAALNLANGPYQAIIPDFIERARMGVASSWMASLQSVGNAIGALAASLIGSGRLVAAVLNALLLGTWAVTAFEVRGLRLREAAPPSAEKPRVTRVFVDLFISRALVYAGFYTLLFNLFFYVEAVLAPKTPGSAKLETGVLIVGFTLVGAIGAALAARPSDWLDKRLVATLGAAAFIGALALFIGSSGFAGVVVATIVAGVGWGAFLVADWAIACRVLPPGAMAAAMGLWNLAIVLPQIIAPTLTSAVLQSLRLGPSREASQVAFALALGTTLVGAAWLWRIPRCTIEQ